MNKYEQAQIFIEWYVSVNEAKQSEVDATGKTDEFVSVLRELVDEKTEMLSRKDKLVVGSEWECVAGCNSKHFVYDVGDVVEVLCVENGHILLKPYAIRDDVIKEQQFLLCFKPKGEKK